MQFTQPSLQSRRVELQSQYLINEITYFWTLFVMGQTQYSIANVQVCMSEFDELSSANLFVSILYSVVGVRIELLHYI